MRGSLSQRFSDGKGPRPDREGQRRGPLRKIVKTVRYSRELFVPDYVLLECGHQLYSNGAYRARCNYCADRLKGETDG